MYTATATAATPRSLALAALQQRRLCLFLLWSAGVDWIGVRQRLNSPTDGATQPGWQQRRVIPFLHSSIHLGSRTLFEGILPLTDGAAHREPSNLERERRRWDSDLGEDSFAAALAASRFLYY